MEFKYSVSKQDYIDFNLNYFDNNAVVQRSIWMMRVATAVIVIIGGSVLMYWLHALTLVSGLVLSRHSLRSAFSERRGICAAKS